MSSENSKTEEIAAISAVENITEEIVVEDIKPDD
jgi:hypothetical protein